MQVYLGTKEKDGSSVSIDGSTRGKHCAIFGKSGVGKTTLMRNMIAADLDAGNGLTVIDPHGALVEEILGIIPRNRTNDVIYLNPADTENVIGLNVLDCAATGQHSLVVSSVISIMRNLWPDNWGPRSEYILMHVLYALLDQRGPVSLAAVPKVLTDVGYRRKIVSNIVNPAIQLFFLQYEAQDKRLREESIAPLLNKVTPFITTPLLRAVIGQTTSSFDIRWAMDTGKVLLCNLSKGALGEDVSSLLGSLIVTKLYLAALSRQDTPEAERRQHFLYADEIQNFTHGVDFPSILAEARKYRLGLTVGTQALASLPEGSLEAIFGNCATLVSFRVSGDDAQALVREFAASGEGPRMAEQMYDAIVPAAELQNLPDYSLYVRTLFEGRPLDPFLVRGYPPFSKGGHETTAEKAIRASRQRYGRDRVRVDRGISRFLAA